MWPELESGWSVIGVGDFNGDGIDDLLLRNADGTLTDWLGSTDGSFAENSTNVSTGVPLDWAVVGTGDFNGGGNDDILWLNDAGKLTDWLGTLNGGFTDNWTNAGTGVGTDWQVVGTGDFNGDGRDDILWRRNTGVLTDWLGTSTGGFTANWSNASSTISLDWSVAGTGDFNGDGRDDVLWRNSSGQLTDWLATLSGGFADNWVNAASNPGSDWHVAGIGDFDRNGRDDILWRNDDGRISDWLGQTSGGFAANVAATMQVDTALNIVGVGDFNGDGRDDALLRNEIGGLGTWTAAADGTFVSPAEKAWQETLAQISAFFDEINVQIDEYQRSTGGGGDQNSFYDDGDYWNRIFEAEADPWSYPNNAGVSLQSFMEEAGALFDTLSRDTFSLTLPFDGSTGLMTLLDAPSNTYLFNVDGNLVAGTMHEGTAPSSSLPDVLVLGHRSDTNTDVYLTFDDMGFGYTVDFVGSGGTAATGPGAIELIDASDVERTAAEYALALLYKYSPTAHDLIDAIAANGTKLNLITANLTGQGQQDWFNPTTNQILWDPFEVVQGTNLNGTTYTESPMMLLAHELVHAAHANDPTWQGDTSEPRVMPIANQIASEMNHATNSNYDNSRDNYVRTGLYDTTSPSSILYSIARPQ
jgi:hypothetical protein